MDQTERIINFLFLLNSTFLVIVVCLSVGGGCGTTLINDKSYKFVLYISLKLQYKIQTTTLSCYWIRTQLRETYFYIKVATN